MKESFRGDFLHFTPEVNVLKKLNRMGMTKMGDPNWHTHIGIMTLPVIMAAQFGVRLFNYGEHGFMNLGGMHSYNDMVEYTKSTAPNICAAALIGSISWTRRKA